MTVLPLYCIVVSMGIEDRVLELIVAANTPVTIQRSLDIRPDQYYSALDSLMESGILSRYGNLPVEATTELCPPMESIGLFAEVFADAGWSKRITDSLRSLCGRYGWVEPPITDSRYTRTRWTGHSYRRVDFVSRRGNDIGIAVMVVGALLPRIDKQPWQRSVPKFRVVYIESPDLKLQTSLVWERERVVPPSVIFDALQSVYSGGIDSALLEDTTLCVAWVCESRALLATKVGGGSD